MLRRVGNDILVSETLHNSNRKTNALFQRKLIVNEYTGVFGAVDNDPRS